MSIATHEEGPLRGPSFFFSRTALRSLALAHRASYGAARPHPHAVIDGFLGGPLASELAGVFPGATEASWKRRDHPEQAARLGQLQRKAFEDVPGALRHLLSEFSGMAFIDFLESLTGVQGLIPDPHFRGAGLHLTLRGGHLALHADFNRDRFRALSRRLTVLYYLNPGWEPAWGGDLELWSADLSRCETRIAPLLDRLVVMAHGDDHWHGHPNALECPEGRGRAAVAAYFYTAEEAPNAPEPHSAIWAPPRS
ncbi:MULTISPECIES: 2OG-Fe(II) oxygenase [Myxococcus]|uniref:SanC n=1 Tax=Myxococcus xanthus TaxID=34 RepID=A0AAE6KSG9_MYXXA|nr:MULTISPECIES: 2OG-Fe(II) oxygenase [Myxococcus]QDE68317.1 SanC [Myxococcus xanthus]QDE75594.1 SanC [Myxococcus xanthus]QDE82921.1 SanC [Myxococcus xanthus]QDF04721.1 SanC [Myxococcus xanthus]WAM29644.1 2OG-Fe(II) oxygenase [Myxococcus sp. NMCA1]